ncbi:MAG TPA: hypothetical protein VN653_18350, partial [Anaerolineales bacterium]|nr:hypothetical protein [Anaerolineales bacterium]
MDKNEFEGKWQQIRSQSKIWWSRLTDSDLNRVDEAEVKFFEYVSILQLKYALDRQVAKDEIYRHVMEYETSLKPIKVAAGYFLQVHENYSRLLQQFVPVKVSRSANAG